MTLSIIIPVYKTGKTLYRCLDSVFSQIEGSAYADEVEVLAVNDASPDDCGELLAQYQKRHPALRIITHKANKGEAGAHNTGIENTAGEYFTFLDSDDTYRLDAVGKLLSAICQYSPDLIHYCYARVDETGEFLSQSIVSAPGFHPVATTCRKARQAIFRDTAFGIMTAGGVYRRAVAPSLRMNPKFLISGERYYGWQFFAKCRTICQLDDVLYDYYQYPNTLSRSPKGRAVEGLLELDVRFWCEMREHPQFATCGKYAFRRLFPGVVGWHYEIVFQAEPEKRKFADAYFCALAEYLKDGVSFWELGLMRWYLKLACRIKSPRMVAIYRNVFLGFAWRIKRMVKKFLQVLHILQG